MWAITHDLLRLVTCDHFFTQNHFRGTDLTHQRYYRRGVRKFFSLRLSVTVSWEGTLENSWLELVWETEFRNTFPVPVLPVELVLLGSLAGAPSFAARFCFCFCLLLLLPPGHTSFGQLQVTFSAKRAKYLNIPPTPSLQREKSLLKLRVALGTRPSSSPANAQSCR